MSDSTAVALRLRTGDAILQVNDKPVRNFIDVPAMARQFKVGKNLVPVQALNGNNTTANAAAIAPDAARMVADLVNGYYSG